MTSSHAGTADTAQQMRALRLRLGEAVTGKLQAEISGLQAHYGEDYERSDAPEALIYHKIGGTFRFLAFSCPPWRMWDFHVGVVPLDDHTLSTGVHISERANAVLHESLAAIASRLGATVVHAPRAIEYQANLKPFDVTQASFAEIESTLIKLCRELPPVVAAIECPAEMKA